MTISTRSRDRRDEVIQERYDGSRPDTACLNVAEPSAGKSVQLAFFTPQPDGCGYSTLTSTLASPVMPRSTERRILLALAAGHPLTPAQIDSLSVKIGKGQKKSRAREITQSTEARYAAQIALMTAADQATATNAIQQYTTSSTVINTACRTGAANPIIALLDATFNAFGIVDPGGQRRVTYRLTTYSATDHMPYGAAAGNAINVGDYISDAAYVSASENRQLLVNGVQNPAPGSRYVKFCIVGVGGINISGGSPYNNQNEAALLRQLYPKTWRVRTSHAGQAEILYPRGQVFRVQKITPSGNDVRVVLNVPNPVPGGVVPKNAFSGV